MSDEPRFDRTRRTDNGRLNQLAHNAVMMLATRLAIIALAGFMTWYGTKLISSFEALAMQTTELAKIVAVLQSEGTDRDRRIDRVEGAIDRLVVRPR